MSTTTDLLMPSRISAHFRKQAEPVDAVATPLPTWNSHCRDEGGGIGLPRGWYIIVGGGTGHGKSLLGLNIGAHAVEAGWSPAFISLEMSPSQLGTRLYAILTGESVRRLERGGEFDASLSRSVLEKAEEIRMERDVGFFTNLEPLSGLRQVVETMESFHENRQVRLYVVDYLQLCSTGSEEDTVREVTKISHAMRLFARKRNVTVIGLSQFNRYTSRDSANSPRPQGLIGSSALENDADQVLLLDHTRYERALDGKSAKTWALLAKNRHGSTGEVPIEWDYRTLRVREADPDEEDLWPKRNSG